MNMEAELQNPSSTSSTTLDDLFNPHNTEVDVGLEWLSVFVEDCFSNPPSYILGPSSKTVVESKTTTTITTCSTNKNNPSSYSNSSSSTTLLKQNTFSVPCKARSKRKRLSSAAVTNNRRTKTLFSIWSHQNDEPLISDPPLLKQTYWLADSELFVLPNQQKEDEKGVRVMKRETVVSVDHGGDDDDDGGGNNNNSNNNNSSNGENPMPRRCTHCLAQRTPQWRAGPLGPKTLCNACGVRYKSGRLLPEYRPAKSPTFVSDLHSNSHKKVLEMRMAAST